MQTLKEQPGPAAVKSDELTISAPLIGSPNKSTVLHRIHESLDESAPPPFILNRQKMRLYHYTSLPLIESILLADLSKGHMNTLEGIISPVVWLTTDSRAEGHGMPNGSETLTDRHLDHLEKLQGERPKNRRTHDKMKVRLTFDIPEDEMLQLQRFTEYCDRIPDGKWFAKWTGLSCYIDVALADDKSIKRMMRTQVTKEKTWWISFMPVSARFITAIELRGRDGLYHTYDFEKFVRPAMAEQGFFYPPPEALRELLTIVKHVHPLGDLKPLVICAGPQATPTVAIRGGGTDLWYEIESGRSLTDTVAYEPHLSAWIARFRTELMRAWDHARESYFAYYPEQRQ